MTLEDIYGRLVKLDGSICRVLYEVDFLRDYYCGDTDYDPDDPEDLYRLRELGAVLSQLEKVHNNLSWMGRPIKGKYRLSKQKSGLYGYRRSDGSRKEYIYGDFIEVLLKNGDGKWLWAKEQLYHNGTDYCLWEHQCEKLEGMTVRERGTL